MYVSVLFYVYACEYCLYAGCLFCFMYMLVCMLVCWVCEGAGSFAGACSSLALIIGISQPLADLGR